MSDRGCDKDGELKSDRALSSKSGGYKEQDPRQVVPFGVDQSLTHEKENETERSMMMMMVYQDPARKLLSSRKHSSLIQLSTIE